MADAKPLFVGGGSQFASAHFFTTVNGDVVVTPGDRSVAMGGGSKPSGKRVSILITVDGTPCALTGGGISTNRLFPFPGNYTIPDELADQLNLSAPA